MISLKELPRRTENITTTITLEVLGRRRTMRRKLSLESSLRLKSPGSEETKTRLKKSSLFSMLLLQTISPRSSESLEASCSEVSRLKKNVMRKESTTMKMSTNSLMEATKSMR